MQGQGINKPSLPWTSKDIKDILGIASLALSPFFSTDIHLYIFLLIISLSGFGIRICFPHKISLEMLSTPLLLK